MRTCSTFSIREWPCDGALIFRFERARLYSLRESSHLNLDWKGHGFKRLRKKEPSLCSSETPSVCHHDRSWSGATAESACPEVKPKESRGCLHHHAVGRHFGQESSRRNFCPAFRAC